MLHPGYTSRVWKSGTHLGIPSGYGRVVHTWVYLHVCERLLPPGYTSLCVRDCSHLGIPSVGERLVTMRRVPPSSRGCERYVQQCPLPPPMGVRGMYNSVPSLFPWWERYVQQCPSLLPWVRRGMCNSVPLFPVGPEVCATVSFPLPVGPEVCAQQSLSPPWVLRYVHNGASFLL